MSALLKAAARFYHDFGIASVHETGRNAYLIIVARACRMFAYGTNSLILGEYLTNVPSLLLCWPRAHRSSTITTNSGK